MNLKEKKVNLPQIKQQTDLPIVLNKSEVKALLKSPKYLKHKLILAMLYGCGLRNYELCALKLSDVDFERKTVFIKQQKGKRDRIVPLSDHLARGLKQYIETEFPEVFLFNSQVTKDGVRQGMTTNGVGWIVKESRSKVNTTKKITAHILRHTYATHLLEQGVNILRLKELLGHARIETTLIYLHIANVGSSVAFSPLDTLYLKKNEK
jgi:site-specific recombinase XerD